MNRDTEEYANRNIKLMMKYAKWNFVVKQTRFENLQANINKKLNEFEKIKNFLLAAAIGMYIIQFSHYYRC